MSWCLQYLHRVWLKGFDVVHSSGTAVHVLELVLACPGAVHVLELVLACPCACPRIVWLKVYDDEVKVYYDVLRACPPLPLSVCG